ncbi:MAG: MerR family transcriptional regulator [Nocardiopsaceae bacterium]|jgi:DNA-binding transcriptional MerR regulator|nr:MerR family transcriptional regulator [Nocardiopsaceae bacterium]
MAGQPGRMTTGEFSRRSQLSIKALRLYDRQGLLRPAVVDEGNGYRGYDENQLFTARLIVLLRSLDMPLHEVARVVAASGQEAADLIESYWASQERRFAAQRQIAATLGPGVASSDPPNGRLPVRERYVPEQLVLTEQRHVYLGQLIWTQEAAGRLAARADRCGGVAGKRFSVFHGLVSADSDGPVEVCVPVAHLPDDPAELALRVEPAHQEAFIQVTKVDFEVPAILSVYDQLSQWVSASGRKHTGSPREVYIPGVEPLFAPTDTHICDVAIPFASTS